MILTGVALAACAALTHAAIDSTRKYAGSVMGIPSDGLVTVPAILDMVISTSGVALTGRWKGDFQQPALFATATVGSSLMLLVSRYMYQRAIQLSPLSLTIPYLAFTPAILIATAYIFLGELPSPSGLLGVMVVTLGGYLLNLKAGSSGKSSETQVVADIAATDISTPPAAVAASSSSLLMQRSASSTTVADVELGPTTAGGAGKRSGKPLQQRRALSSSDLLRTASMVGWHQEPGTVFMIGVAIIWSVTASLDKLGVLTAPSIWVYFAAQRAAIGLASLAYILAVSPRLMLLLRDHFLILLLISALELAAVLFFLLAVRHLLVSYVVAIKRCSVLFSVVLGALLFRESVGGRLPYVFLMMLGMTVIVLEPGAHIFLHSRK